MGTTPLWVPLAVAGIAVLGTLAGVIFTQVWNSRHEERRWNRETERLREAQAREDLNRTYDHRRAAYVEFQQELDRLTSLLHSNQEPIAPGDQVYDQLTEQWTLIRIYGTYEADMAASDCLRKVQRWGLHPDQGKLADAAYSAGAEYLFQLRKDLGIPEWKPAETIEAEQAADHSK